LPSSYTHSLFKPLFALLAAVVFTPVFNPVDGALVVVAGFNTLSITPACSIDGLCSCRAWVWSGAGLEDAIVEIEVTEEAELGGLGWVVVVLVGIARWFGRVCLVDVAGVGILNSAGTT
jgi:hypothetical protein